MPPYSDEYQHLKDRVELLSKKFLEDQIVAELADPVAFVPDMERIAAFRFLVHAEVEEYIEKKAKNWIDEKEAIFSSGAFSLRSTWEIFPISILLDIRISFGMPFDKVQFTEKIKEIIGNAKRLIKDNNGIKSESFMKLSILCGKMIDEVDTEIAIQLTEYGKGRGDIAHKSLSSVSTIQAPSVEQKRARDIVESLGIYFYNYRVA